jgi:hypothetical protein
MPHHKGLSMGGGPSDGCAIEGDAAMEVSLLAASIVFETPGMKKPLRPGPEGLCFTPDQAGLWLMPGPHAGRAYEQVCERGAQLLPSGEPSSQTAFQSACGISFPGRDPHAASSFSVREGLVRHCCRGRRSVRWFNLHWFARGLARAIVWRVVQSEGAPITPNFRLAYSRSQ